jgi:hypothetical protein
MVFQVNAGFAQGYLFRLQQPALQAGVGLADKQLSARADDTMPRDSFSGRRAGHGASGGARATRKTQDTSDVPVSKNTPPGDLFYEIVDRIPRHRKPLVSSQRRRTRAPRHVSRAARLGASGGRLSVR